MTLRLVLGIDPGQTGAIASLADGEFDDVFDMPTVPRNAGGFQVEPRALADGIRRCIGRHPGASVSAVIEIVSSRPGQGSSGMFRFGQSDGMARGVIGAMGIKLEQVRPEKWKKFLDLTKKEKDDARLMAIVLYPAAASVLQRKKDCGRADALLIARWSYLMEMAGNCS